MKFVAIKPGDLTVEMIEADSLREACVPLGLLHVDHSVVARAGALRSGVGVGIVVGEFSLYVPPGEQRYFAIGRQLYAGNAVAYGFDDVGESVDIKDVPVVLFLSLKGVEDAIKHKQIERPCFAINGIKLWEWPEPRPAMMQR